MVNATKHSSPTHNTPQHFPKHSCEPSIAIMQHNTKLVTQTVRPVCPNDNPQPHHALSLSSFSVPAIHRCDTRKPTHWQLWHDVKAPRVHGRPNNEGHFSGNKLLATADKHHTNIYMSRCLCLLGERAKHRKGVEQPTAAHER